LGLVTGNRPRAHPVLYLPQRLARGHRARVAAPTCISGRTSYLRVRLAFHPYPQVIPLFCNTGGCGPRRGFTPASPCPWIAHPVSGRIHATARPVQTRFRSGSTALPPLNLPGPVRAGPAASMHSSDHSTKGTPAPRPGRTRARRATTACRCGVSGARFIPLSGCFSPFPHGTRPLSVASGIAPWRVVPPASHGISRVPWYSGSPARAADRRLPGSHRLRPSVPGGSASIGG